MSLRHDLAATLRTLRAIHRELDGQEWSADTCNMVARHLREAGFEIGEPGHASARAGLPRFPPIWAAYAGSANGSEITLHTSEDEALGAVAEALGIDTTDATGDDLEPEDLRERITDHCSQGADDWEVQEVELP